MIILSIVVSFIPCGNDGVMNLILFLIHLVWIILSIYFLRKGVKDPHTRFLSNNVVLVLYLFLLFLCLQMNVFMVKC